MQTAIRHPLFAAGLVALWLGLMGCNHAAQEELLTGSWEGFIELPATGEEMPIAYRFADPQLTVHVGPPDAAEERVFQDWEVHSVEEGVVVVYVYDAGRTFATMVRIVDDDHITLWDQGLDESTAAEVWRVETPAPQAAETPAPQAAETDGD